ncbi:MAG: response regulator transcription factor [Planctomycetaceae bacterium]|nr:response regulator transcription factor [Planctomycetaceae bacterium]
MTDFLKQNQDVDLSRDERNSDLTHNQTVFIIDDDDDLRKSLAFMMESFHLKVKAYSSATAFLDDLDPHADGCAIVDIRMPGMDGIELQEQLIKRHAMFPVLILTANAEVPRVVEAMQNGAHHLLLKSAKEDEIVDRVFKALEYSRKLQKKNLDIIQTRKLIASLSRRESQVMNYVVDGSFNREIAEILSITVKTVEAHRAKVMKKMGSSNVAELVHEIIEFRRSDSQEES